MAGILDFLNSPWSPYGTDAGLTNADQVGLLGRALAGFGAGLNSGPRGLVNQGGVLTMMPSNNWGGGFSGMSDAYSQGMNDLTRRVLTGSQMKTAELNRQKSQYELDQAKQQQAARDEFTAAMQSGDPARIAAARQKFDPNAAYAEKLAEKAPLKLGEGDTLVDPRSFKPLYQGQPKETDFLRNLRAAGIDPSSPEGQKYIRDYASRLGGPVANINMNAESEFTKQLGTLGGKDLYDSKDKATAAAQGMAATKTARQLLDQGIYTGPGANFQTTFGAALAKAGIGNGDAAARTQAYVTAMAGNTLQLVKTLGSSTSVSNADREFAEKAAGGNVEMSEPAIRRILDINERASQAIISQHNKKVDLLEKDPNVPAYLKQTLRIDPGAYQTAPEVPAGAQGQSAAPVAPTTGKYRAAPPDPAQRIKGAVYSTPRGDLKWTGTGWIPAQ